MSHDFILAGVILSPIIPAAILALLLTAACSWLLVRLRLYRVLWRRPLVEAALFCIFLGLIAAYSPIPGTR